MVFQTDHAAIKVGGQDENAGITQKLFGGKSKNQPFSIYVDQDPPQLPVHQVHPSMVSVLEDDIENFPPTLDEAVARLPAIPQPSALQETKGEERLLPWKVLMSCYALVIAKYKFSTLHAATIRRL